MTLSVHFAWRTLAICRLSGEAHCWLSWVQGPEVGEVLMMLEMEDGDLQPGSGFVPLPQRIERLKTWLA